MNQAFVAVVISSALLMGGCATDGKNGPNKETVGTVIGGVLGAVVGSQIGNGKGQLAATAIGTLAVT